MVTATSDQDRDSSTFASESKDGTYKEIENDALQGATRSEDPNLRLQWAGLAKSISETQKLKLDIQNALADAKHERTRFWATVLTPLVAVTITAAALVVQAYQFRRSNEAQREQAAQQAEQNEDSKWRDLLKSVSFQDPKAALVGALAMEGFFDSPHYRTEARSIATALLPIVNNVNGFDQIVDVMTTKTNDKNQKDLSSISSMLLLAERDRHKLYKAVSLDLDNSTAFLNHDVKAIDPNPSYKSGIDPMRDKVAAWQLDTVSSDMRKIWKDPTYALSPAKQYLAYVVLENGDFSGLDFKNAQLPQSILYDACFKNANFNQANLTEASFWPLTSQGRTFLTSMNLRAASGKTRTGGMQNL
jgi:hypothetical protein